MTRINLAASSISNNFITSLSGGITSLGQPAQNYLTTQWTSLSAPNVSPLGKLKDFRGKYHSVPTKATTSFKNDDYILIQDKEQIQSGLSTWEAYTTCINMYVGMSLLSMGYSLASGGYMQAISLAWVMFIGYYTGLLMVACFDRYPDPEVSYEKLGGFAMGKLGPCWKKIGVYMVAISVTVEFIGFSAAAYVFLFRHAHMLLKSWLEFRDIVIMSTMISFPTVFALNFTEMTIWSLIGTIAPTCVVIACISLFLVHNNRFNDHTYESFYFQGTGVSAGIFLYALGGHAALPSVYNSMRHKESYPFMVRSVFSTMFILYTIVAFSCLFTFGEETNVLITENYAVWPGGFMITLMIVLMLMKCISLLPGNINMVCEIPESIMGLNDKPNMKRLCRGTSFVCVCALGWLARDHLDVLEAITGASCTMATSVIFPLLFYILILWQELSICSRIWNIFLLLLSIVLTVWFTWQSIQKLQHDV